jgi:hypothetical protein
MLQLFSTYFHYTYDLKSSKAVRRLVSKALSKNSVSYAMVRESLRKSARDGSLRVGLSFDVDLELDIKALPWLLRELGKRQFSASFACIGQFVEKFPNEHKAIVEAGHEIMNHTYSHPFHRTLNPHKRFLELSDAEMRLEIQRCHETFEQILSVKSIGFRTPHFGGLHTFRAYPILYDLRYRYSSSTIGTRTRTLGTPFLYQGIFEIPLTPDPTDFLTCVETWKLFRAPRPIYRDESEFVRLFSILARWAVDEGASLNFYFDPIDLYNMGPAWSKIMSILIYLRNNYGYTIGAYRDIYGL